MGTTDHTATPVALVPLRTGGKSRLGDTLPAGRREALVLAMLDDVVATLNAAGVRDVRVLAGDRSAARAAEERGLPALLDPPGGASTIEGGDRSGVGGVRLVPPPGERSLRAAVDAALDELPTTSIRLVVAADLPRLGAGEVRKVLADRAAVVVAPTRGGGTAILRLAPGVTVPARYGPGSAAAHAAVAEHAGWSVALLDLPGGSQDVDDGPDLLALQSGAGGAPGPATTAFLAGGHG